MKILIENSGYHLRNLGDVAMLQAAASVILELRPQAQLRIFTTAPERLSKLIPDAQAIAPTGQAAWLAAKCWPVPQRLLPRNLRSWVYDEEKVFKFMHPVSTLVRMRQRADFKKFSSTAVEAWLEAIRSADIVIATGGGFFTNAFAGHLEGILHTLRWAQVKGKPTALMGQGLGPLSIRCLRRCSATVLGDAEMIGLREGVSGPRFGQELGCSTDNWRVTGDEAFVLLNKIPSRTRFGSAIGVNLRLAGYAGVDDALTTTLQHAFSQLRAYFDTDCLPLPVDLCPENGDAQAIEKLIPSSAVAKTYQLPDTPEELVQLVDGCRIVVTGSYHAAVFALARGIPVIALVGSEYYVGKFTGLKTFFEDSVELVELHNPELSRELLSKAQLLWDFPAPTKDKMQAACYAIASKVKSAYCDLFKNISPQS